MFALAPCVVATSAYAHAPQARGAALTSDATKVAVVMPGFGLVMRAQSTQPFKYICDALLDDQPTDQVAAAAYLADGSLLLGSINGVRVVGSDSCPAASYTGDLSTAVVLALAAHGGNTQVAYAAATTADKSGVWRSDDAGKSWTLRSALANTALVTALLVDETDPNLLYVSQGTPDGHSALLVSMDGGLTFAMFPQDRALTLLHLPIATGKPFWALSRSPDNNTNRGFDMLRADTLAGPFQTMQRVNYFGGFAIEPGGTIWVGDEGGGLYRSADGGGSFTNVAPDAATACLVYAADGLWACTPGTNQQPALSRFDSASAAFTGVVAFGDVTQQVVCPAAVDARRRCASAWTEWQHDVLMNGLSLPDAGVSMRVDSGMAGAAGSAGAAGQDAGVMASAASGSPDASAQDAARASVDAGSMAMVVDGGSYADAAAPKRSSHSGCSISTEADATSGQAWLWLAVSMTLLVWRARRRLWSSHFTGGEALLESPQASRASRSAFDPAARCRGSLGS